MDVTARSRICLGLERAASARTAPGAIRGAPAPRRAARGPTRRSLHDLDPQAVGASRFGHCPRVSGTHRHVLSRHSGRGGRARALRDFCNATPRCADECVIPQTKTEMPGERVTTFSLIRRLRPGATREARSGPDLVRPRLISLRGDRGAPAALLRPDLGGWARVAGAALYVSIARIGGPAAYASPRRSAPSGRVAQSLRTSQIAVGSLPPPIAGSLIRVRRARPISTLCHPTHTNRPNVGPAHRPIFLPRPIPPVDATR
jgi:hypothetical protein